MEKRGVMLYFSKKANLVFYIFAMLIAVTVLYGCGGSSSDDSFEQESAVIHSDGTVAPDGTLSLVSETGVKVVAAESGSLPSEAILNLVERDIKPEEKSGLGDTYNKVIELSGYKELDGGRQILNTSVKPITITIPNRFSADYKKFYVAFRPSDSSTWQYQLLPDNGETLITSSRASYAAPTEFKIVTSRIGYCFTIIGDKLVVPVCDIIKTMSFSVVPEDYELASATLPEERFAADCVFLAHLESEKESAIFDGIKILTEITYYSDNTGKSSFKIDGKSNYKEEISNTKDPSYNKYEHKIILDSYSSENFEINSAKARYGVTFNIKDCLINEFPDDFRIKVSLTTQEGRVFSNERQFVRTKSQIQPSTTMYLKMVEPSDLENVSTSTKIILASEEKLDWSAESASCLTLTLNNFEIVKSSAAISEDMTKITITPEQELKYETEYLVNVAEGLKTIAKNKIVGSSTFNFKTETATQTLSFAMITPSESQLTTVATNTYVVLQLSEALDWHASDSANITLCYANNEIVQTKCDISDDFMTVTLIPQKPLNYETDYVVKIGKGLKAKNEFRLIQSSSFAFKTCSGNSVTAEIEIPESSKIGNFCIYNPEFVVNFKKAVASIEKTTTKIKVLRDLHEIAFNLQFDSSNTIATLSFAEPLMSGQYTIKMTGAVKDIEGLEIAPLESDFVFETLPDVIATLITPATLSEVATDTVVEIGLSEPIDWNDSLKAEIRLTDVAGIEIPCDKTYDSSESSNIRIILTPIKKLLYNSSYKVVISEAIVKAETQQRFKSFSEGFVTISPDDGATVTIVIASETDIIDSHVNPKICYASASFVIDFVNTPFNREEAAKAIVLYSGDRKVTIPETHQSWTDNKLTITLPDIECGELITFIFASGVVDERNVLYKGFGSITYRANYFAGRGTEEEPYLIASAIQLDRIRDFKDMGLFFEQIAEIDFTDYVSPFYSDYETNGFEPIGDGDNGNYFVGHYNGNDFPIKGVFIDRQDRDNVSIFGSMSNSEISNIYVSNEHGGYVKGNCSVAAIVSTLFDSKISSCTNEIDIYAEGNSVGGIVGYSEYDSMPSTIEFCENRGNITSADGNTGGIVGYIYEAQIVSCINNGNIEAGYSTGGIIGGGDAINITDCTNYGSIIGFDNTGGICGYTSWGTELSGCINNGLITAYSYEFGGIIGYFEGNGRISYCQNNGSVVGVVDDDYCAEDAGGIVGYACSEGEELIIENSTNTADIVSGNYAAGIVAYNDGTSIYHCTNSGRITAEMDYAAGIIGYYCGEFYLEWCVNTGEIIAPSEYKQIACYDDGATVYDSNNTPPFGE